MNLTRRIRVVGDDLLFDGQVVAHFCNVHPSLMDDLTLILESLEEPVLKSFVPHESEPLDS